MKQFNRVNLTIFSAFIPVMLIISLFITVTNSFAAHYYCYQDVEGGPKFFVRLPITQVQATDSAIGKFANGMVALASMVKRNVAFVEVNGNQVSAEDFISSVDGKGGSRLILQYLPASGSKVGILPPGSMAMSHTWLVEAAPGSDVEAENGSSSYADMPNESFPVIVITEKMFRVKTVKDLKDFDATAFDSEGKLTNEFFLANRSNMKFIQLERHHDITAYIRIKGQDHWDEMLSEVKYGSGHLYGTNHDLFYHKVRALDLDCLTAQQAEYVRSNWFGRRWTSTKETAGAVKNVVNNKLEDLNLLGQ